MKKISKCLLLVVAVVSFVCLLFYKTQYDKLYNVLEVLEFFGSKDAIKASQIFPGPVGSPLFRPPAWQNHPEVPDVYIYSSFCSKTFDSTEKCPLVKTLAVGSKNLDKSTFSCKLWYEDTLRPIFGIFSAEELKTTEDDFSMADEDQRAYLFICESKFPALTPFGISIVANDQKKSEVFSHVESDSEASKKQIEASGLPLVACIRPQTSRVDSTQQLLENILLHRIFGIQFFYIYDSGLTSKFIQLLSEIDLATSIKILPWNLPSGLINEEVLRLAVQTDCYQRTSNSHCGTVLLEPHQILTPVSGSLQELFKDSEYHGKLDVPVKKFCQEIEPEKSSSDLDSNFISLLQTSFSKKLSSSSKFSMSFKLNSQSSLVQVSPNVLSIHDYGHCSLDELGDDSSDIEKDNVMKSLAHQIHSKVLPYIIYRPLV